MKPPLICLIGPPGSGKSTIGKRVAAAIMAQYVSTGDIARAMVDAQQSLKDGGMAPDHLMAQAITEALHTDEAIVLDSIRYLSQVKLIEGVRTVAYIVLVVPKAKCVARLIARARGDDDMKTIQNRFVEYERLTLPMCQFLLNHRKLNALFLPDYPPATQFHTSMSFVLRFLEKVKS